MINDEGLLKTKYKRLLPQSSHQAINFLLKAVYQFQCAKDAQNKQWEIRNMAAHHETLSTKKISKHSKRRNRGRTSLCIQWEIRFFHTDKNDLETKKMQQSLDKRKRCFELEDNL